MEALLIVSTVVFVLVMCGLIGRRAQPPHLRERMGPTFCYSLASSPQP